MRPIPLYKLLAGIFATNRTDPVTSVVTDSRKAGPGSVFVAIQGERVDGHAYVADTIKAGALLALVTRPVEGVSPEQQVLITDPLQAMITMGKNYRDCYTPTLLGVTGSVGKTTTKEFCAAVFSAFGPTVKTQGNQNNELGVPNTLFSLDETTQYGVVEMGMDHMGDLARLTWAVQPAAAIITRIGVSHIENLGSRENILKAKLEICQGVPDGGFVVLCADDDLLTRAQIPARLRRVQFGIDNRFAQVVAKEIRSSAQGERFVICDKQNGEFEAFIPALGRHNIYNALAAYTAATRLGLDPAGCAAALSGYQTTGMRQRITLHGGMTMVEDCYNANPDSMAAALNTLAALGKTNGGRTVAVLGDMLELGDISPKAHFEVGVWAAEHGVSLLCCCGEQAKQMVEGAKKAKLDQAFWFATKAQAAAFLAQNCRAGDTVLFKASRGMAFEELFGELYRLLDEPQK